MTNYQEIFAKKIEYFHQDYLDLLGLLGKNENVAYASSPATGEERFMEYAAYWINKESNFTALYVKDGVTDLEDIVTKVKKSAKTAVIIMPYFYRNVEDNAQFLRRIKAKLPYSNILAVVKFPWDIHVDPAKYTNYATLFANLSIRKPLRQDQVEEAIELRKTLHNWQLQNLDIKKVMLYSGGLLKLIKRIASFYDKEGICELGKLVNKPQIMSILAGLAEVYSTLPLSVLVEMGLVTDSGHPKSLLLKSYLDKHSFAPRVELSGKSLTLFNLMYENRNKLVTDEMIDAVVRNGRSSTLWANYKLVARLKKNLRNRYKIRNVKGKGYVLSEVK